MMIRTAGGPGLVSPIDFNERRGPRLSRGTWTAIALVAAAHAGVGAFLYFQKYELNTPVQTRSDPSPIDITFQRLEPKPVEIEQRPAAANPPIHRTDAPPANTETVTVVFNDNAKPTDGPAISLTTVVDTPTPEAPPAVEPQPPAARVITNPSWSRQPSADQMMRAYPSRAMEAGLSGSAQLNCLVQANGTVSTCEVVRETPSGQGFGRAAQQLSRYFRINPRTVDGAAEGTRVSINLRFVPPAD